MIPPDSPHFSGFVFKIQANMNKRHRDRIAFLRVCSGVFEKDMVITNAREGQEIRAARPYRFFGGKRETIDRAFPGDVVGLVNPGQFGIGDTLYADVPVKYPPIPRFPAEHFGVARLRDVRFKQFDEAIRQLEEEGLMQVLFPTIGRREPILGTVGPLQLEVLAVRLKDEYNVDAVGRFAVLHRGALAHRRRRQGCRDAERRRHPPGQRPAGPAGDVVRDRMGARVRAAQQSRRVVPRVSSGLTEPAGLTTCHAAFAWVVLLTAARICASAVSRAVRVVLLAAPIALTSLKSVA